MSPPTIYELCQPRADVLEGRIRDEDFAADLSQVLKGTAPELYKNPALFFANTHPTRGLRELFQAVVDRLTSSSSQLGSILRLDTSYGGGKTHALIGLNHILTAADQIPNLAEFIDPARLPSQKVTVAAFDGENADPMNGRRMEGNVLAFTPWGELAVQLAGPAGYERIRKDGVQYWEDLEPRVKAAVRQRIEQFQASGIRGVDLYLSSFGPALEEFSLHWPIERGQPKPIEENNRRRGRAQHTPEELQAQNNPYAVSPEDALDAARREVKAWRMEKLTSGSRRAQLDPLTEWFVLAWDAFEAPQFPYDEALRLARVVGLDLDKDVVGVLAEKKTSDLILWDSSTRATKGKLGAPDGTKSWIDAIHHCAHRARSINLGAAKQLLDDHDLGNSPEFLTALQAVLEVLPLSSRYSGYDPVKNAIASASDFEALEDLRRLDLKDKVPEPNQLQLDLPEQADTSAELEMQP